MSRSRRSVDREIASIFKGMEDGQRETGQTIMWHQFDTEASSKDPVYDEGPSRRWKTPRPVKVMFAYFMEAPETPSPEGFYLVNTLHFTVSMKLLRQAGIKDPENTALHMHDRFEFNGNMYSIDRYQKQGLVRDQWMTVAVDGHQVKDDELVTD